LKGNGRAVSRKASSGTVKIGPHMVWFEPGPTSPVQVLKNKLRPTEDFT
jgi:hypothetical protein